jgi:hypothetical protein
MGTRTVRGRIEVIASRKRLPAPLLGDAARFALLDEGYSQGLHS